MSLPTHPVPSDPAEFFKSDDALEQWKQQPGQQPKHEPPVPPGKQSPTGFPPEVPRHPPNEAPEYVPPTPQEVPPRRPSPMPDWSPSSGDLEPPVIDEPQNATEHSSTSDQQPSAGHDHA